MPDLAPVDTDDLPPTQYLILEVLAARWRTGAELWTFPNRLRWALLALADAGLIALLSGVEPRTVRARLTEAGRRAALDGTYEPPSPLLRQLTSALNVALYYARPNSVEGREELAGCLAVLADATRAVHGPGATPAVHPHLDASHDRRS
jgi:hypothetical protein